MQIYADKSCSKHDERCDYQRNKSVHLPLNAMENEISYVLDGSFRKYSPSWGLIMSKAVTSTSSPMSAIQSAKTGGRHSVAGVSSVFAIPPVECMPKQLNGIMEKMVTKQVRQIVGAHQRKGDLGSGCVIIISSKGIVQVFRKNADGSVGGLIVEAAAYPESNDK